METSQDPISSEKIRKAEEEVRRAKLLAESKQRELDKATKDEAERLVRTAS